MELTQLIPPILILFLPEVELKQGGSFNDNLELFRRRSKVSLIFLTLDEEARILISVIGMERDRIRRHLRC